MWDNVELLISDDTGSGQLSISSRQECGSALYQMNTLLKMTSSQKVLSNPELNAYCLNDGCVLVADRTVVALDNICQTLQMFIHFETKVDIVGLCQEGQFLVAGERSGNLHLIHVSSKQTLLTKALVESSFDEKAFLDLILKMDSSVEGIYHAFILTSRGFFCIMHIPLANIQNAIIEMDINAVKKLQSQVETCFIAVEDYHTAGCFTSATMDTANTFALIIGGVGNCVMSVWEVNPNKNLVSIQNVADSSLIQAARKLQAVENLLFVLDDQDVLSLWDLQLLILTWVCPSVHIEEFLLTSESDFSAGGGLGTANLKLVALTTPDHVEQMKSIVIFSLPTMQQLYALEITPVSSLVQSVINTDTIYFMEGMYENNQKSSADPVSFLLMRSLTEALPENRLSRLLHKHKFAEAESFALQFGLEIELVYKVKANAILEGLASAGSEDQSAWLNLVLQAKETLDKIKDNSFVVEYCINTPWLTYETAQEMLNYARMRTQKKEDVAVTHFMNVDPPSLLTEVLRTQAKLATFYEAFGPEKYSGTTWFEFVNNKDVFSYILSQLRGGKLSSAQYLWLRHQAELERSFSQGKLDDLLSSISGTLSLKELGLWLKEVVLPFVRRVLPHGQKTVAKWLEDRARSLELTDKANWPENGLELAQVFFTSTDVSDIGLASFSHWDFLKDSEDKEIRSLMDLVSALQNLVDLHRKYNCRLALCDFEKKTANTIVFCMLDKILAAELLPGALEKYIEPYMCRHHLEKDEILLQYIKDLLLCQCTQSSSIFDTTWEAKAIALLGCMSSLELIFDGVLALMHSAVVPWSPGVEDLVQRYLGMGHAKVKLLEEGHRLMEMKKILRSYGIRDTNLLNDKQMILMLAKYILKQNSPSALEDALKLIKTYMLPTAEVHVWKIADLIDKGKGEDVLDLLKSLPPSEAVEIAERTLIWGKIRLEEDVDTVEEKKTHLQVKKALVEIFKFLLSLQKENHLQKEEREKDLETFKILVTLQESFDICISHKDYCDPSQRAQLLEDHLRAYERARRCTNQEGGDTKPGDPSMKKELTQTRLYRLGFLLQKSDAEMGAALALHALEDGKVEEALQICSYFYESHQNEETGRLLFLVSQKLCHMLGSNIPMVLPGGQDLPDTIYTMACQAATLCSPDLLLDISEFCKYASFAREIYAKCQMEDFGFIPQATSLDPSKDPYADWTFEDFFTEDGAVLDTPAVVPVTYKIASSLVPLAEWEAAPLESSSLAYCSFEQGQNRYRLCENTIFALLSSLQEGSQYELALGLVSYSFWSLLQHMISNNMDLTLSKKLHDQKTLEEARSFLLAMRQNSASVTQSITTALLRKVFNSHQVDHQLAFGYCTLLPRAMIFGKLWDIVNQTSQNYKKILAVAVVGSQLALHYEDPQEKQAFEELVMDAEWGLTLGKLGISFQNIFRMPSVRKKELLRTLVQHPNADTSLILKFCRAFHLDTDAALQVYIETQLQHASRVKGELEQGAKEEPYASVVARALETIPLLGSTTGLMTSLSTMLHKVDPYNYEAIETLLTVIERSGGQATGLPLNWANMLLKHLKSYKRLCPPGDLEHQFVFDQGLCLSPAAQTRLPFHLIFFKTSQCFWKIISAEINQESFPKLLLICKVMKVSLDNLYVSAVNHIFQEQLKPKLLAAASSGQIWPVDKRTEETMQAVQSYLLAITKPEWATALAHQIAQELPTGPTKVQTLTVCLGLAETWLRNPTVTDDSREKAQVHLKKLQGQHKKAATEAVLAAQKLNSEDHQKLLGKPANLIILLYQHSSIAERIQNPTGRDYPDIHAAAREIAQINNLDLKKIWDTLLERWLCPNVLLTGEASGGSENVQEDEDLKRIIYLLQLYPVDNQLRILYECAMSTTSPIGVNQLTFAHRSRALRCLLFLADPAAVESLFKIPMNKVRNFMKCLIYLAELEVLNIPYTYESFQRAPKEGLIKGLWKNHSHEPKAVKLVAELCMEYKVHDPVLWNGLLQKLMGFKMVHYLRKVLVETSGIYSLWLIPNYSRAWHSVILAPVLSALCPPNPDQLEVCCRSFKMLLMCPVLADLDLIGIAKRYAQLDLVGLALGCLVLIPYPEKRAQEIQALLSSSDLERLLQQTEEQLSLGEAAGVASQIRSLILDYILHEGEAKDLVDVKYFPLLKLQERRPGQAKGLVEKLVAQNRMEEAASLITEYLQKPAMTLPPNQTASEIVKMYFSELAETQL
ncbi:kinetochore-associated protein 1 [Protobothrops mucrosquamatus]|uniref:kinetochore-associated protein 1 n=1 Tax=Protobothrops mucrosquamatus TaxID=103944 RepID=UPI0010FAD565|nr:kinetochore-associated protein 1 [Protobothrops mucrosquamatus]